MAEALVKSLRLESIRLDGGSQMRKEVSSEVVAEYLAAFNAGEVFGPLEVMFDGEAYWLVDGFHRHQMYREAGRKEAECRVSQGSLRDARIAAAAANQRHGLRRDYVAKRKSVLTLLHDEEWGQKSNYEIARHVGVSESFVRQIKKELSTFETKIAERLRAAIPPGVIPHEKMHHLTPHPGYPCYDDDRAEWYRVGGFILQKTDEEGVPVEPEQFIEFRTYVSNPDVTVEAPVVQRGKEKELAEQTRIVRRGDQEFRMNVGNIGKTKGKKDKEKQVPLEVIENNVTRPLSAKALEAVLGDWVSDRCAGEADNLELIVEGDGSAIDDLKDYLSSERKVVFNWADVLQAAGELVRREKADKAPDAGEVQEFDTVVFARERFEAWLEQRGFDERNLELWQMYEFAFVLGQEWPERVTFPDLIGDVIARLASSLTDPAEHAPQLGFADEIEDEPIREEPNHQNGFPEDEDANPYPANDWQPPAYPRPIYDLDGDTEGINEEELNWHAISWVAGYPWYYLGGSASDYPVKERSALLVPVYTPQAWDEGMANRYGEPMTEEQIDLLKRNDLAAWRERIKEGVVVGQIEIDAEGRVWVCGPVKAAIRVRWGSKKGEARKSGKTRQRKGE